MDIAAVTGLRAASMRMDVAAANIANINTPDYKAYRAVQFELPTRNGTGVHISRSEGPPDLVEESVNQLLSLRYAQANGAVMRTQSDMLGELVNLWA